MKRILIAFFCLAGLALAQTAAQPAEPPAKLKWHQKVIDLKYASPNALTGLLRSLETDHRERIVPHPDLQAISVGSYDPAFLALAEQIVQRYDVPQAASVDPSHDVEIVAHILLAGPRGSSGSALPAELEPVAKQLRSVFGYNDLRLLDTAFIRSRTGKAAEVSGVLSSAQESAPAPSTYRLIAKNITVTKGSKGSVVGLDTFRFYTRVAIPVGGATSTSFQNVDGGFDTDISILEGQKVVVGESHLGSSVGALILVVSARVVD